MGMANQPSPETVTVSFTLPRGLAEAVAHQAKKKLTNKSDIIRRALLAYIPPDEAEAIMASVLNDGPSEMANQTESTTTYKTTHPRKRGKE